MSFFAIVTHPGSGPSRDLPPRPAEQGALYQGAGKTLVFRFNSMKLHPQVRPSEMSPNSLDGGPANLLGVPLERLG